MLPDKGFNLENLDPTKVLSDIWKLINVINWNMFCMKRPLYEAKLVQKFYSNLTSFTKIEFLVQGKKVSSATQPINGFFFHLPNKEDDNYSAMLKNVDLDLPQEVLKEVTIFGSKWVIKKYGSDTCRREFLNPTTKIFSSIHRCQLRNPREMNSSLWREELNTQRVVEKWKQFQIARILPNK
ncbi:uncharacterized protein LOC128285674 [Gossypium arboreum]|uniref:Uncharacterized protein n=1 Tax=Gossypium arboreum TaxID=29729 RepID=A0ABR0MMQ6_GOSAR|nr:uncharacterized protein LOC128285674 [Gossypium arboreum]KAK5775121.1 hypothetical protein PVK06_042990 [Gossypium arboreum]